MKKHSMKSFLKSLVALTLCLCMGGSALADVLTLPAGVKVIEEEAFFGDTSLDEVVLPEGVEEIGERAFAESSVSKINLPDSLTEIGENAFDLDEDIELSANEGSYAHEWLEDRGYYDGDTESPVTDFEFTDNGDGTCTVSKYIGSARNVVIPRKNGNGQIVTKIGQQAFHNCSNLSSITIPDSVTSIGSKAFYGCSSLAGITIPQGVKSIDSETFSDCSSLSDITIPDSVKSIGAYAFSGCSALSSITIPESVTSIGGGAFRECSSLETITIPDGVKSIGSMLFYDCSSLDSITIPDSVTRIEAYAFYGCESLTSISIPEGVTSIGGSAFSNCSSLTSIIIPDSATSIGSNAFYNCSSLKSITIPDGVTSIGFQAFYNCRNLESVTIPYGVTSIGFQAFYKCSSLSSITIPDSVISIGKNAFQSCSSLPGITIPGGVTSIADYTFSGCTNLENVTICEGVTSISQYAFSGCSSLFSITIPNSMTSIEYMAFSDCSNLSSITIPDGMTSISSSAFNNCNPVKYANMDTDGAKALSYAGYFFRIPGGNFELYYLYNNDIITDLGIYNVDEDTVSITIPEGVTKIATGAFLNCSNLSGITIPDSVTSIDEIAFSFCSSLSSIVIPDSVTSIGSEAFRYCSSLKNITIPDNVTSIGKETFYGCSSLKSITIPDNVTSIGKEAFYGCSSLTNITIPYSVTSIGENAFYDCSSLSYITIPEGVTSIEQCTFHNCSSLSSIMIPESVTSIGNYAFSGCSGLKSIIIPDSVTSIGQGIFEDCTSLTSIYCVENSYVWEWFENSISFSDKLVPWDGDPSSLPEENQLTGSFADSSMTLTLGGPLQTPAATVRSNGNPIYRVSLTINGWSQDETGNDRYRSHAFEGLNLHEISLTDPEWANEYVLDTTQPPLNVPGEYTLNLWASTSDEHGSGVKLDSMTVTITPSESTLSGTITTSGGEPVSGVRITAVNPDNLKDFQTAYSDQNGFWSMEVTYGATYNITYWHVTYTIGNNNEDTAVAGSVLSAVAVIPGDIDPSVTFEMKNTDGAPLSVDGEGIPMIKVNKTVCFEITAPGCTYVRMIADGICYDQPVAVDTSTGKAEFNRAFNLAKESPRQIQFQVVKEGEDDFTSYTPVQLLHVYSENSLNPVEFAEIPVYSLSGGEPLTISWRGDEHAVGYKVYFNYEGYGRFFPSNEESDMTFTTQPSITYKKDFPSLFRGDKWYVAVVAIGQEGWNSSTSVSGFFTIVETLNEAEIIAPSDGYQAMVEERLHVKIARNNPDTEVTLSVTDAAGNGFPTDDIKEVSDGWDLHLKAPGNYTLSVMVNGEVKDTRSFTVKQPEITVFYEHEAGVHYKQFAYELVGTTLDFHVTYNFTPVKVVLCRDGNPLETTWIDNSQDRRKSFTLTDVLALDEADEENGYGTYIYTVKAYYGNGSELETVLSTPFSVYAVVNTGYKNVKWIINSDSAVLYLRPDGTEPYTNENLQLSQNEFVVMGTKRNESVRYGDFYEVKYKETTGFINIGYLTRYEAVNELSIQCSLDENENVLLIDSNEPYMVNFDIQAPENIDKVRLNVLRIPENRYASETPYDNLETVSANEYEPDSTGVSYHFQTALNSLGMYKFSIDIHDRGSNAWIPHGYINDEYIIVVFRTDGNFSKYAYCKSFSGGEHSVMQIPLRSEWNAEVNEAPKVKWNDRLDVIGYAGNDISYIECLNGDAPVRGFIAMDELIDTPDEIVKRGYVFVSADDNGDVHHLHDEEYENNTFYVALHSGHFAYSIFTSYGVTRSNLTTDYDTTDGELLEYLEKMVEEQDENDLTYLYITAHGWTTNIHMNDTWRSDEFPDYIDDPNLWEEMVNTARAIKFLGMWAGDRLFGGHVTQETLAKSISRIKGGLVFIYESCHSGSILDYSNYFDIDKHCILSATSRDQDAYGSADGWVYTILALELSEEYIPQITLGEFHTYVYNKMINLNRFHPVKYGDPLDPEGLIAPLNYESVNDEMIYEKDGDRYFDALYRLVPKFQQPQKFGNDNNIIFWLSD